MRLLPALVLSSAVILHVAAFPTFANETKPAAIREKLDLYGDRLPPGAVLRLGTIRLRHASNVVSVAYSPDGRILATAFVDPEIRLWDVPTGRLIRTLVGSSRNTPRGAAFSPDGRWLAVTCDRGNVQLWDPASGHLLWEKDAHRDRAEEVTFAPDGRTFATAGGDSTVRLWEAATGEMTAGGLKELREISNLRMLNLSNTKITGAGLKELREFRNLTTVFLYGNHITKGEAKELRNSLPNAEIIQ